MSDLTKSIVSTCNYLINKETNKIIRDNTRDYYKALEIMKKSSKPNQEILLDKAEYDFYVNVKNDISIKLYKELSTEFKFNEISEQAYETLHEENQIVKEWNWRHIAMQTWDILIIMNNSAIAKEISESEFMQKNKAVIKWEDCFIETSSPGWRDGERYKLTIATQDDLKAILNWLTKLL